MPSIGALAAVFDQNRVLLTLRSDLPAWVVPGGGVEPHFAGQILAHPGKLPNGNS
jgi:hypothetical protein